MSEDNVANIIIAAITTIGSIIGGFIGAYATIAAARLKDEKNQKENLVFIGKNKNLYSRIGMLSGIVIGAVLTLIASSLLGLFPPHTQVLIQKTFSDSTPIPRTGKILELNFSSGDRGTCITDDSKIGGYDTSQDNYFVFGQKYGYITYCNISEQINQGSIEVKAEPNGSPNYFGYGVLIGFIGGKQRNYCSFEIIKDFSKTKIIFGEYINNKFKPSTTLSEDYTLDTNPHTLRMVLYPDGKAIGYIEDIKIAEHTFAGCSKGRIGFITYGQGDDKIFFDDLKLYAIPK